MKDKEEGQTTEFELKYLDLTIFELIARIYELEARNAELRVRIKELEVTSL
jgi:hypothetical protein